MIELTSYLFEYLYDDKDNLLSNELYDRLTIEITPISNKRGDTLKSVAY